MRELIEHNEKYVLKKLYEKKAKGVAYNFMIINTRHFIL